MSQRLTGNEPGLVAYYRLDEGGGNTASDASGNGGTGTLLNGPTWTANSPLSAEQKIQVLKVPEFTDVTVSKLT
mgnify:CR=1 FL=1